MCAHDANIPRQVRTGRFRSHNPSDHGDEHPCYLMLPLQPFQDASTVTAAAATATEQPTAAHTTAFAGATTTTTSSSSSLSPAISFATPITMNSSPISCSDSEFEWIETLTKSPPHNALNKLNAAPHPQHQSPHYLRQQQYRQQQLDGIFKPTGNSCSAVISRASSFASDSSTETEIMTLAELHAAKTMLLEDFADHVAEGSTATRMTESNSGSPSRSRSNSYSVQLLARIRSTPKMPSGEGGSPP